MRPTHPEIGLIHLQPSRWTDLRRGRHRIAAYLSRHFPSVWVDPPVHWRDAVRRRRRWRAHRPEPDAWPDLVVYEPGWRRPFFHGFAPASAFFARRRLDRARGLLASRGCRRCVLMVWRPRQGRALDLVAHDLACYYINDEYTFSMGERPTPPEEEALLRRADLVFIHSPTLLEKKGRYNLDSHLSPNGVDADAYGRPRPEPESLAPIPRPRVGYAGGLKKQLDWDLIESVARGHPDVQFVFVGPVLDHAEAVRGVARVDALPNTWFLGGVEAEDIPAFLQHVDVGILPYARLPYTEYIDPLKFYEYLAAGLPAIGTPIDALRRADPALIELAADADAWGAALDRCLAPEARDPRAAALRRAAARDRDWSRITDDVADHILRALEAGPTVAVGSPVTRGS